MSNPAAYAGELLHNIIEEKNNSPEYNVSIYISTLWGVKKQSGGGGDNSDKLSKTGDTMFGPLDMGGNKITGLYNDYLPTSLDDGVSWGNVLMVLDNYVHKNGGMMTGWLGVGQGITLGDGAVKIIREPIEDEDAANKQYVDSKTYPKPIISIWAAAKNETTVDRFDWFFGASGKSSAILNGGYKMTTNGRVLRSATVAYFPRGIHTRDLRGAHPRDLRGNQPRDSFLMAKLVINGAVKADYELRTGVMVYNSPLELHSGDIITFMSSVNSNIASATINLLIELDF
jgi:hypothetical protein